MPAIKSIKLEHVQIFIDPASLARYILNAFSKQVDAFEFSRLTSRLDCDWSAGICYQRITRPKNRKLQYMFDVAIIGGGVAGMATAARLQAKGLTTIVCEAHRQPGGCAGYFKRRGFAFDVGATTLVDFEPGGVGGELLEQVGLPAVDGDALPGYVAWMPDLQIVLHRDPRKWAAERLLKLGASPAHQRWWEMIDRIAEAFWNGTIAGSVGRLWCSSAFLKKK